MKLETKRYYDDETMEFIAAKWFVDGGEVSFDEYMDIVDGLEEYNDNDNDNDNDVENVEEVSEECEEWKESEEVVCDNCEDCEIPPEICEEINLINEAAEMIENGDMCPVCLRNALYDLYIKGKNVGWNDHKDMIREINEDE